MSTKLFLPLFCAVLLAIGLGLFTLMLPHARGGPALPLGMLALGILAHVPAFVPVGMHGRLVPVSQKALNTYPEIPVPFVIAAAWALALATRAPSGLYVAFAVLSVCVISLAYAAVRAAQWGVQKLQSQNCQSAAISVPKMVDLATRYIFALRAGTAVASLAALGNFLLQNALPFGAFGALIAVGTAIPLILVTTWVLQTQATDLISKTVADFMARQLKARPAQVAVYHTGMAQRQIAATTEIMDELTAQNIPFVLIAREKAALAKLPTPKARHVWLAPTLATLTECAHPSLTTVLYPQDAPKNSHFTRFPNRRHVLFTALSDLSNDDTLPKSVALYDTIIAPSEAKANQWRNAAAPDLARRITCLSSDYALATRYPGARPVLGLFVGTAPQDPAAAAEFTTRVLDLAKAVHAHPQVRLQIWCAPATATGHDSHLRHLHRTFQLAFSEMQNMGAMPLPAPNSVSLHTGSVSDACNAADILLASQTNDLDGLMSTQKPVVWIDDTPAPFNMAQMGRNADTGAVDIDSFLERVLAPDYRPPMAQTHFRSLAALCACPPMASPAALQERSS